MPHSTQNSLDSRRQTFDLTGDQRSSLNLSSSQRQTFLNLDLTNDDRPVTPPLSGTMLNGSSSRPPSGTYGVAVTSPPDERSGLPSQRDSTTTKMRRKSSPATAEAYADYLAKVGSSDPVSVPAVPAAMADRNSMRNDSQRYSRSYSYDTAAKRRSQYFEEQAQMQKQSPVIAELKTNVIIKDEFTLVTDLSYHLAQRYTRPDSCIMIKVDHSACLALGGTFDPCYILTINAVSSQMAPTMNKRNSALIQSFMADILSVPPERGILTFMPIPEENLAMYGTTVQGEMEKFAKQDPAVRWKTLNDTARKSASRTSMQNGMVNGNSGSLTASNSSDNERSISMSKTPPPMNGAVQELSGDKIERPSTAQGPYAAANGLRMNGISAEELQGNNSRTPNGRPKTYGGPAPASIQDQIKNEPLPQAATRKSMQNTRTSSSSKLDTKPRHIPIQPKTTVPYNAPLVNVPLAPRAVPVQSSKTSAQKPGPEMRPKNTYLDNVSTLTSKTEPSRRTQADAEDLKKANTAKRRSTVTATPKIPKDKLPPPPPEPAETRSVASKLSKRKSFTRFFKRDSVPAWYK